MKTVPYFTLSLMLMASAVLAYEVGQTCFSKQATTPLLATADREAAKVGTVEWGKPLKVLAEQGRWLQVTDGDTKGWVYAGNVSSVKPPAENKNDFLPTTAADTTAAVAARPLSESSKKYASRKSLGEAAADVEWAEKQADAVTRAQVNTYMQEKGLGDYGK
ncbi:MAG: hypothetical protein B9S32_15850 [Verrucomicrobia bacterium Tous-C9LFEB]|nr:MAG: hypothetical protein B9S32_15850 [Verrucomicrobia bacterium Tous-C9LFEB]